MMLVTCLCMIQLLKEIGNMSSTKAHEAVIPLYKQYIFNHKNIEINVNAAQSL